MRLSFDDEESFKEAAGSLLFNNPPSDPNSLALRRAGVSSSMLPHEGNEDICFNNSLSDLNSLQQVGSGTSSNLNTPPHGPRREVKLYKDTQVLET